MTKPVFEKVLDLSSNFQHDYNFNYALSLSDLLLIKDFKLKEIDKYLYENGMDISQGWEAVDIVHRNLQNKVVDGIRFHGVMRTDDEWKKKGVMTAEDVIMTCDDADMRDTLKAMNQHSRNTDRVIKAAKEYKD